MIRRLMGALYRRIAGSNSEPGRPFQETFSELLDRLQANGPVCHVGSKTRGATDESIARWRGNFARFSNSQFVGIDIESGPNVDVVVDLCKPSFLSDHPDLDSRFGFIFCSALLEHVADPFSAARNIQSMLRPGGHLYYRGPWVWGFHSYPSDYWRISIAGLKVLFPRVEFVDWWYMGTKENFGVRVDAPDVERKLFQESKLKRRMGRHISDRGMPYLNIGAIGVCR
jgi:SAM-dependent methyltransferase